MNRHLIFVSVLFLCAVVTDTSGRGATPPPPPFSGGNVGDWLGNGPLFGFDYPLGPGFGPPPGGGASGFDWDPSGSGNGFGFGHEGGSTGPGCDGTCLKASLTGPCRQLCDCYGGTSDYAGSDPDVTPDAGAVIEGVCIDVRGGGFNPAGCVNEGSKYSYVIEWSE